MSACFGRFIPCCLLSVASLAAPLSAQTPVAPQSTSADSVSKSDPELEQAVKLLEAGKMAQAMPFYEKLCSKYPKDGTLWEGWGVTALSYSQTLTDPDLRKKGRVRARSFLVKAQQLGDKSNLLQELLGMVPEDGGDNTFSSRKEVNDVMQQAEADFSRGDFEKAREGYLRALLLDPKNYAATLFMGDVYFKQHVGVSAGDWFARAVEIDPNQETAYRYWGDALWAMGQSADAREKYIQAIVADPYNNRCWIGLNQWAQRSKVALNWVHLQDGGSVTQKDDQHINITIDPSSLKNDLAGPGWLAYTMNRALWKGDKFKKEFPNETAYRHTMKEEVDSLQMLVNVITEQKGFGKKKKDLDPGLLQLIQIDKEGFLEPFVLLNRADKEIAQDYPPYRDGHRDTIYRYFDEFVVPKAPQ